MRKLYYISRILTASYEASVDQSMKKKRKNQAWKEKQKETERVEKDKQRRKEKKKRIRKALVPIVRAGESEPFPDLISD